ncbi:MAG TPA: hypothetical protein VK698_37075 [Kofleriaceae bacterium]|nr:hypothetical protein [Kofleriaceae bacterium]
MKTLAMMSALVLATGMFTSACMTEGEEDPELETAASALPITADFLETKVVPFDGGTITLDNKQSARLTVSTDPGVDVLVTASIDAICTDGEHVVAFGRAAGGGQPLLDITAFCASNHVVSISDATVTIEP